MMSSNLHPALLPPPLLQPSVVLLDAAPSLSAVFTSLLSHTWSQRRVEQVPRSCPCFGGLFQRRTSMD